MKSTVSERLIESWLDSQTERRYQPAFIQLLVSEGWTVLHNTRHSPIELGKDVIARDPSGKLFCFQLKGNPGSRVTKSEAASLLQQVIELIELPPPRSFRRSADEKHAAVFVTNGEVDEEARVVFEAASERVGKDSVAADEFHIWSRGTLLKKLLDKAGGVWPTSVEGTRRILELLGADGRETPKPTTVVAALAAAVPAPNTSLTGPAKNSALSSLFLLAEIVKSPWYQVENHYALYEVTVLASVYALQFGDSQGRQRTISAYAALAAEHCADLVTEAKDRDFHPDNVWAEHDPLSEFDVMWERRRLVADCATTLVLAKIEGLPFDKAYTTLLLDSTCRAPRLWGLAALPALIVRSWARARVNPTLQVDRELAQHLSTLVAINLERSSIKPLAPPYYSFEDMWADALNMPFFTDNSVGKDNFRRRGWFMRAIFYMLAKRNLKQTCKAIWPSFSKLVHEEPDLPLRSFFSPELSDDGKMVNSIYHGEQWQNLVREAVSLGDFPGLDRYSSFSWLIAAYVAIVPYRASTQVLLWLDSRLNATWYHKGKLP